jgi:hypothetical protein
MTEHRDMDAVDSVRGCIRTLRQQALQIRPNHSVVLGLNLLRSQSSNKIC